MLRIRVLLYYFVLRVRHGCMHRTTLPPKRYMLFVVLMIQFSFTERADGMGRKQFILTAYNPSNCVRFSYTHTRTLFSQSISVYLCSAQTRMPCGCIVVLIVHIYIRLMFEARPMHNTNASRFIHTLNLYNWNIIENTVL